MTTQTVPQTANMDQTQSLAKRDDGQMIRTPKDYTRRLQIWNEEQYHVLSPFANFAALPEHWAIVPTLVQLNPDPTVGDVYQDKVFTYGNDVALSKIALAKIAQAAGMSIVTERVDDRSILNLWEVRATVKFVGLDGTVQAQSASEELDLRDGSARSRGFTEKQLLQARSKGLRGCESRAINAAIRLFGIKQKYTKAELEKPFVIVRIVHQPDMSDPETRRQVTARALAGTSALYGATTSAALPASVEPQAIGAMGVADPAEAARNVTPAKPAAPPTRTVQQVDFDIEASSYDATLDGGELVVTQDHAIGKQLNDACKAKRPVIVTVDEQGAVTKVEPAAASAGEKL